MAVSFQIGDEVYEIGSASFFHAFFSTVSYYLDPDGWGTRYPELMCDLYNGELGAEVAAKAYADVLAIREQLKFYTPDQVIWDSDNLDARPPWGSNRSPHISDLANYFWTSDGKNFFEVLLQCLADLYAQGGLLRVM